jgi:hypothetical protein
MSRKMMDEQQVIKAITELPRDIAPRRDLWPGIASRLKAGPGRSGTGGNQRGWRVQTLAASLAIAFVAGILLGRQLGQEATPAPNPPEPHVAVLAALQASEREYQAAFREFIPVGAARHMLESQAVQNIENSWFEMQQAESALLAALSEYPENTYLSEKLMDLRAQQLGFMQQLAMLDQFSRRKT